MGPAMLLAAQADFDHRQATVKQDWARSRPVPRERRDAAPRRLGLRGLSRRAVRLLHV